MKYALTFLAGAVVGLYGGAWILGVVWQSTPETPKEPDDGIIGQGTYGWVAVR